MVRRGTLVITLILLFGPANHVKALDWPQWLGPQRDGVWRETELLQKFPPGGPKVLWRVPLGPGYTGPAVANGKVYVMDRERAKDAEGKDLKPEKGVIKGTDRIKCLDAATGREIWQLAYACDYKVSFPSGPRCTPLVHHGKVYCLGTMGDFHCLDAETGKVVWHRSFIKDYGLSLEGSLLEIQTPAWGYSAHPLIDGDLIYTLVGGKDRAVVAFDKNTGKEVWHALNAKEIGYAPPTLIEAGGKRQLIVWLSETLNSLNPRTGEVYWTQPYPADREPTRPAVTIQTPTAAGNRLFISSFYHGPLMMALDEKEPKAKVLWQSENHEVMKSPGLAALMATPVIQEGHLYGNTATGEIECYEVESGKRLWQTFAPVQFKTPPAEVAKKSPAEIEKANRPVRGRGIDYGTVFIIPQGDRHILFNDSGELILARLSPKGYEEFDRAKLLDANHFCRGRWVVWCHPAFANRCVYVRNDAEIICVSLAAEKS
jgi:outer membrane protein assembly factor BamB